MYVWTDARRDSTPAGKEANAKYIISVARKLGLQIFLLCATPPARSVGLQMIIMMCAALLEPSRTPRTSRALVDSKRFHRHALQVGRHCGGESEGDGAACSVHNGEVSEVG